MAAFLWAYMKANLAMSLEYRLSFVTQILGMMINDVLWVAFWVLYFTKFPVLRGWTLEDVIVLWASVAFAAGLVFGLLANSLRIPTLVVRGQLDYYLALPKNVLLHLLVSQIRPVNLGDLLFAPILLIFFVDMTWTKAAIFLAASTLGAIVMLSFFILAGLLAFYMGNSETFSNQMVFALLHFATYPAPIFDSGVKMILFTLVPAAFVSTLPVELVRQFEWAAFLQLLGGAVLFFSLAVWLFHRGLRRYESGNLIVMRG